VVKGEKGGKIMTKLLQVIKNNIVPISMLIISFTINVIVIKLYNITWKFGTPMFFFVVSLGLFCSYVGILLDKYLNYLFNKNEKSLMKEFKEKYKITVYDLKHAIRLNEMETVKKICYKAFDGWLSDLLEKVTEEGDNK
jgi:hypothetical protein